MIAIKDDYIISVAIFIHKKEASKHGFFLHVSMHMIPPYFEESTAEAFFFGLAHGLSV